jgi:hypothetical protein
MSPVISNQRFLRTCCVFSQSNECNLINCFILWRSMNSELQFDSLAAESALWFQLPCSLYLHFCGASCPPQPKHDDI